MSVNKNDIEFYIEREYGDFLERMTDDEIDDVVEWCNRVIEERQKIEKDILTNIKIAMSEAKDTIEELYHGKIDISFITMFDEEDFSDCEDNIDYTIETAVKKLYPDFPILENLDSFERENLIDTLVDSLDRFDAYWD
nr:MAG TPA: hypothetical protein [Caudoviricetes sp.]